MNLGLLIGSGAVIAAIAAHAEFIKKAAPYRQTIREAANKYGINPSLLAALLWRESRFNPHAKGTANDTGMAQFTPIAVTDIVQNGFADGKTLNDFFEPYTAIHGAAFLLNLNHRRTGNIFSAIRAYNVGSSKAISDGNAGAQYLTDIVYNAAVDTVYRFFEGRDV